MYILKKNSNIQILLRNKQSILLLGKEKKKMKTKTHFLLTALRLIFYKKKREK